jgi:hypothetical protein
MNTHSLRFAGTLAGLLTLQAVLVFAFVFPGYKPQAHHIPVGVVGSAAVPAGDELDITHYESAGAARRAIEHRDVYGAIVAGSPAQLLVASAASPTVAQLLRAAVPTAAVEDVVPLDEDDPRGATINLLFLPLISVCFSVVLLLGRFGFRALVLFAALGGLGVAALLAVGLSALPGSYLALSAVLALTILAIAAPAAALHRLLGVKGIGVAAVLFLVIANPASGNATAPELLPGFWRALSGWMPPGAGGAALRNTAYFDGHAVTKPLLVLATYAVVGLAIRLRLPLRTKVVRAAFGT